MREIRFRAWHEHRKVMVFGPSDDASSPSWVLAMCSANNLEPMQYTGLKDKNKKEIYEGDIVKYKELIPSENPIQKIIQNADYVYLEFIGKVIWDEEGASFDIDGGDHGYRGFGARGQVENEVIGNIYDNPELLVIEP